MSYDRFQPESREDYLFRGKTVFERREIAERLKREEQKEETQEHYRARIQSQTEVES